MDRTSACDGAGVTNPERQVSKLAKVETKGRIAFLPPILFLEDFLEKRDSMDIAPK